MYAEIDGYEYSLSMLYGIVAHVRYAVQKMGQKLKTLVKILGKLHGLITGEEITKYLPSIQIADVK
jgi:hypothetical protein